MFVTLGLLFPWMTREYILWKMTFHELMLYYVIGTEQHLKLSGLYAEPESGTKSKPEVFESNDHERIYEYYHNQKYDESTWKDLM